MEPEGFVRFSGSIQLHLERCADGKKATGDVAFFKRAVRRSANDSATKEKAERVSC